MAIDNTMGVKPPGNAAATMKRYPDKPTRCTAVVLPALVDGDWLAQLKYDGWRCQIAWDGRSVKLTSRRMTAIPATARLREALRSVLSVVPPAVLDSEWMSRRDRQPDSVRLFDLLEADGADWRSIPATARWEAMLTCSVSTLDSRR